MSLEKILEKALELACIEAADDQCPYEFGWYECNKCETCPHDTEFYEDSQRDVKCWKDYYIKKAKEELE